MICRLAGVPHFFIKPNGSKSESGGCKKFDESIPAKNSGAILDRTEFYREMAAMEIEAVIARGERTKKLTIAEILVSCDDPFWGKRIHVAIDIRPSDSLREYVITAELNLLGVLASRMDALRIGRRNSLPVSITSIIREIPLGTARDALFR